MYRRCDSGGNDGVVRRAQGVLKVVHDELVGPSLQLALLVRQHRAARVLDHREDTAVVGVRRARQRTDRRRLHARVVLERWRELAHERHVLAPRLELIDASRAPLLPQQIDEPGVVESVIIQFDIHGRYLLRQRGANERSRHVRADLAVREDDHVKEAVVESLHRAILPVAKPPAQDWGEG